MSRRGVIDAANPTACRVLELNPARRVAPVLSAYISPAHLSTFFRFVRALHSEHEDVQVKVELRTPRRGCWWALLDGRRIEGDPDASMVSVVDISEQERSAMRLRDSEARMRKLVESLPDAVFAIKRGVVVECNPAARRLVGLTDVLGQRFESFVTDEQRSLLAARLADHRSTQTEQYDLRLSTVSGEVKLIESTWLPISIDGEYAELCVARDRTEQRTREANAANQDRLATAGVLAAGVAHELNNPLTYVTMNLGELRRELQTDAELDRARMQEMAQSATEALDGARRMARIVSDLQSVAGVEETLGAVDLNAVVHRSLSLVGAQLRARTRVITNLGQLVPVVGDEGRLTQVTLNLVLNAIQAMGKAGGTVEISTFSTRDAVSLVVRDEGPGVPQKVRDQLFEPFVTTKDVGEGTGLGLYVCHRYVKACRGKIEARNRERGGAEFTVQLIPFEGRESRPSSRPHLRIEPTSPRRILIVDDEPLIRELVGRRLRELGEVVVADSVEAAVNHLEADSRFDAVLCDLLMPVEGGRILHDIIDSRFPDLMPALGFMTGGAVDTEDREFLTRQTPPLLAKPFDRFEVAEFIQERFAASSQYLLPFDADSA